MNGMYVYRCRLRLDEPVFYATREIGRLYITDRFLHNYALTYALRLAVSPYRDLDHRPRYKEDLEPLNGLGIYVTPAAPLGAGRYMVSTFKFGEDPYHVEMAQSSKNIPSFGRVRELGVGSQFDFFLFSFQPLVQRPGLNGRRVPRWVRIGKRFSKAEVMMEPVGAEERQGRYVVRHPMNPLDLPSRPLGYDLINMPPVSLVVNAHLEGRYYVVEGDVCLPVGLQYRFE